MKKNEKISFVIPMYNAEKYIEECINSIINQDYPNKEIIVVDDESTDESVKICNSKYNGIIKLITKNNFGAPAARNVGINEATGKYIMLIDSDDCLSSDNTIISRMIKKMQDENSDIIMGNMNVINEKSEFIKEKKLYFEEIKNEKLKRCLANPLPSNKIYNLEIYFLKQPITLIFQIIKRKYIDKNPLIHAKESSGCRLNKGRPAVPHLGKAMIKLRVRMKCLQKIF